MQTPNPSASEGGREGSSGEEREAFRTLLDLYPFPSLLVAVDTGDIVLANDAARTAHLPSSADVEHPADCQAQDREGTAIDARQFVPYLLSHASSEEGVEIAWQTPQQHFCFRVFARTQPAVGNRRPLALLTFLNTAPQKSAETQLRQTLAMRDESFAIAAHELKDPLFAIQLSLQFLRHSAQRQGALPPHLVQHLEVSERQAERLGRLIGNLLDASRIANQRLQLEVEPLDLGELAREMAQRFQPKARSLGITLQVEKCQPLLGYFDRLRMEQIFGNLLSNALKYGAGKPVAVRVSVEDDRAVVEVEDRGSGIAPEDQERIFERYERLAENHKKESLGLGLYITRALVEAHGGVIRVRSELGQGATFRVTLPRHHQRPNEQACGESSNRQE